MLTFSKNIAHLWQFAIARQKDPIILSQKMGWFIGLLGMVLEILVIRFKCRFGKKS